MRSRIRNDERGQGLVEYALIIALIGLASIVALGFMSNKINGLFSKAGNSLNNVPVAAGGGTTPPPGPTNPPAPGNVTITAHNSLADANAGINPDGSPDAGDFLRATNTGWTNSPTSYTYTWHRDTSLTASCTFSILDPGQVPNFETLVTGPSSTGADFQVIGPAAISIFSDPYRVIVTAANGVGPSATSDSHCLNVS
jgi:pilus assembly protein Flp/PilA